MAQGELRVWIEYFAHRAVVMNPGFEYRADAKERYNDSLSLLITRDYEHAMEIIDRYSISYILIDPKMQPFMYSDNNIAGLPFLLESIESFKNVYNYADIQLWKVDKSS